jgi:hypothetical protein
MAQFRTTVDSLSIIDGERQSRTWNARAVEPVIASPESIAKGSLYILLELGGEIPASPRLHRLLLNTIQGVYYSANGGIKGGLTEAILAGHQAIQDHNNVHPEDEQLGGVSCVVLRGDELFLGIGGPAAVLVGQPTRIDQYPAQIGGGATPLGSHEAPTIEIFRTTLQAESLVLQLASEWLARLPSEKLASAALASDPATSLEYLEGLAPAKAVLSALAIGITVGRPVPGVVPPESTQPVSEGEEPELAAVAGDAPPSAEASPAIAESPITEGESDSNTSVAVVATGEPASEPKPSRRWPWVLVFALPIILVAVIALAFWWQRRSIQMEVDNLLQGAQAALQAADQEGVPDATAREQLVDARDRTEQALSLLPDNATAITLQEQIRASLNEVDRVTPLYKLLTLQELGGPDSDPAGVIIQGSRVFLLDTGLDQVVRFDLDEVSGLIPDTTGGLLMERGQPLPDGQLTGEMTDMAWADAGGARTTSNLLVLDSNDNLLQVDNTGEVRPLPVANRETWDTPRLIESYNGNLYVLDAGSGRILRYLPTSDGYSNPPENYFENDATLDLSRAVDMAIDGNIWVLYRDGTVQTFFQGRQQAFELEPPPDTQLIQPQALFIGPDAGTAQNLYIVDSGNGRILEYDKTGQYLRQFRPVDRSDVEKMRTMRDLQVDEIDGTFYIVTDQDLLTTDIP